MTKCKENNPHCPICNTVAKPFFKNLKDYISQIDYPGILYCCINRKCKHLFVFPTPDKKTISSFYASYYTHKESLSNGYKFSYISTFFLRAIDKVNQLLGVNKERNILQRMLLDPPPKDKNKFLEIGCGAGNQLVALRALGWDVTGQDIDEGAKQTHEKNKLNIYYDDLQSIGFEANYFDAIGMNHVIEHLSNPNEMLHECFRILKDGGTLVVIAPNGSALGGKLFKKYWSGYDFPRHLNIFSENSLISCALNEGFEIVESKTSACHAEVTASLSIETILYKSHSIELNKYFIVTLLAKILQIMFFLHHKLFKKSGEELVVILKKR